MTAKPRLVPVPMIAALLTVASCNPGSTIVLAPSPKHAAPGNAAHERAASIKPAVASEASAHAPAVHTTLKGSTAANPTVTQGPAWVSLQRAESSRIVYSANGKWYAALMDAGVLVGDSATGQPLAFSPIEFDKSVGIVFHPSSQYLLTLFDFQVLVWSLSDERPQLRMRAEPPLPGPMDLGLTPPAFNVTGQFLAVFENTGALIYDFAKRKPILRVYPGFDTDIAAAAFNRDSLIFAQATTGPCRCDNFGGSDALISIWQVGSRTIRRQNVRGDLLTPLAIRGGRLVTRNGVYEPRLGKRITTFASSERDTLIDVFRLREASASLGLYSNESEEVETLALLPDSGSRRVLTKISEISMGISVRPQDDVAFFFTEGESLVLHRVDLTTGDDAKVPFPKRLCVDDNQVLEPDRCSPEGPELARAPLPTAPEAPEIPVVYAPERTEPTRANPGKFREMERD